MSQLLRSESDNLKRRTPTDAPALAFLSLSMCLGKSYILYKHVPMCATF